CAYGGGDTTEPVDGLHPMIAPRAVDGEPYGGDVSATITLDDGLSDSGPDDGGGTAGIALIVAAYGLECGTPPGTPTFGSWCEPVPPSRMTVGCAGSSCAPPLRDCDSPAALAVFGAAPVLAMSASARICVDCSGSGVAPGGCP